MKFEISDKHITIGEGKYPLSELQSWKVWLLMDGKLMAKVQPKKGSPMVCEVNAEFSFRDMSGMPIVDPDYFILSWSNGMEKPECVVRSGGKHMAAEFEVAKPKRGRSGFKVIPGFHEGKYDSDGNDLPEEEDDGA